jgi:fatty-acyl-CoA synthase
MARNHRGFVEATIALSKLGAHALYLNTAFAGPQITDVCRREAPAAVVYDEEFAGLCAGALEGRRGFVAWSDTNATGDPTLEQLIAEGDTSELRPPAEKGRVIILTSGTTGTPKGASRKQPESLDPAAALLAKIPLRARESTHIAAPMFHSWGFAHFTLGMSLSSTLVLTRRFEPEAMLRTVRDHRCTALIVVPVMLQRAMELPEEVVARYDLRSLRVIAASGSALPGELASRVMDRFGDVLYNLYGSTEVAWATVATPQDMRAAPGTAGPPAARHGRAPLRRRGERGAPGRHGPHLRRQRDGLRGLHGRRRQGGARRAAVLGRRGALRRPGPPLRRRPRRRDDRVRRGERLPARGRGPAQRPPGDRGGGRRRGGRRRVRPAPAGPRRPAPGAACSTADEVRAYVKEHLARYKVPRDVVFLPELPRNATGKILKRELSEPRP